MSQALFATLLVATLIARASSHGHLVFPPSRNYQAFLKQEYYCPHCGQGKGSPYNTYNLPSGLPSVCGDPFQDVDPKTFTPFTNRFYAATTLVQGQMIDVRLAISTNHGGRMRMAVCPKPRNQVTQACFDDPGNWMRRVNTDPKYNNKVYWYLSAANNAEAVERFRLPPGVNCDGGCMMQWYWVGYQSCTLPCESPDIDVAGECNYNPMNPPVGLCNGPLGIKAAEIYYNCADIIIQSTTGGTAGGGADGGVTSSPPPPTVTASPPPPTVTARPPPPIATTSNPPPPARTTAPPPPASTGGSTVGSTCPAYSTIAGVIDGCRTCVASGRPEWMCTQSCAAYSKSAPQMASCASCLTKMGDNAYGCANCMSIANGDASKSDICMDCVKAGYSAHDCGQCLKKATASAIMTCYTCLKNAGVGGNTWPCVA